MSADSKTPIPPVDPFGARPDPQRGKAAPEEDPSLPAPPLPHERDQTPDPDAGGGADREITEQAARDIARGLRDTDRKGIPSDVPGPGAHPERTPGADVPPEGVQRPSKDKGQDRGG